MMPTSSTTSSRILSELVKKGLIPGHFKETNRLLALDTRERLKELVESVAGLYEIEKRPGGHASSRKNTACHA